MTQVVVCPTSREKIVKLTPFIQATVMGRGHLRPDDRRRVTRIISGHCRLCSKVFLKSPQSERGYNGGTPEVIRRELKKVPTGTRRGKCLHE